MQLHHESHVTKAAQSFAKPAPVVPECLQPADILQYAADYFNAKVKEQQQQQGGQQEQQGQAEQPDQ